MEHKHTKTFTFHSAVNYGAVLQTLALQKVLIKYGIENMVVDYRNKCFDYYNPKDFSNLSLKHKVIKFIKLFLFYKKLNNKYINFKEFIEKNIILTKPVFNKNEINSVIDKNDILITGSDQVWNIGITNGLSDIYTLNIGNESNKRISYAASVGVSNIDEKDKKDYLEKLSAIDYMSVREETAKKEIENLFENKKIDIVLDPTLLLTKDEWFEITKQYDNKEKEKYIVAYSMEKNPEYVKIVNSISNITGYKIIYFDFINPGFKNTLKNLYVANPYEFVNIIKNAEYIVTNSFHGTVFSIIFNKKFWVIPHKTNGTRMINLLNITGISNRTVSTFEEFLYKDYNEEIDYQSVNHIIDEKRKESIDWLINAIGK